MKTKYIKTPIEIKPQIRKYYFCLVDGNSVGLNVHSDLFDNYKGITHWLQEIPDETDELLEMLQECQTQLTYLNEKQERGTTNNILSRLETILNK